MQTFGGRFCDGNSIFQFSSSSPTWHFTDRILPIFTTLCLNRLRFFIPLVSFDHLLHSRTEEFSAYHFSLQLPFYDFPELHWFPSPSVWYSWYTIRLFLCTQQIQWCTICLNFREMFMTYQSIPTLSYQLVR